MNTKKKIFQSDYGNECRLEIWIAVSKWGVSDPYLILKNWDAMRGKVINTQLEKKAALKLAASIISEFEEMDKMLKTLEN